MPVDYKLCSFNCVYCHYGPTEELTLDTSDYMGDLPDTDKVIGKLREVVKSAVHFDYITFSGNGEPTLHPDFPEIVKEVVKLRDEYRPVTGIALLSNSSLLMKKEVREVINLIDLPMLKLDAGSKKICSLINGPHKEVNYEELLNALSATEGICIQTVLMKGSPSNAGSEEINQYYSKINKINPVEVHIYSLDRPVGEEGIKKVPPEELEEIADKGSNLTGVRIKPYYLDFYKLKEGHSEGNNG